MIERALTAGACIVLAALILCIASVGIGVIG